MGGKKVEFIHTTSLTAQTYQARDIENYKREAGEGEGEKAHWGYRVFDIAADGTFLDEVYPVELGHIRVSAGYDELFRRKHGGLISPSRPMPTWLPFFSSFL